MGFMISRPARALLPAVLAVCAMFGMEGRAFALLSALLCARGCSLCAGAAFRRASGRILSETRLRGNFITALLMCLAGGAVSVLLFSRAPALGVDRDMAIAGALFALSQVVSDRLYALTDSFSAPMCDALAAAIAAVGLLLGGVYPLIGGAVSVGVAGLVYLGMCGLKPALPGARTLAGAPVALIRGLLIPAFVWLCVYLNPSPYAVCAGCGLIALCDFSEAPYRRSEDESHGFIIGMVLLTIAAATVNLITLGDKTWGAVTLMTAFAAAGLVIKDAFPWRYGLFAITSACAAFAVPSAFAGMFDYDRAGLWASIALMVIALLLIIPDIKAVLRKARALRLSRRRRAK